MLSGCVYFHYVQDGMSSLQLDTLVCFLLQGSIYF